MLPDAWTTGKRSGAPLTSGGESETPRKKRQRQKTVPTSSQHIQDTLEALKDNAPEQPPRDLIMDCVSIMDATPMGECLRSFTREEIPRVPIVSRAYEERYMRECKNSTEKPCVMSNQCECMMLDAGKQFVGVKFEIPDVSSADEGMCVLCLRKCTTMLFYKTLYDGLDPKSLIQKYGNICNSPAEYHPSAMLVCPVNGPLHCMPVPIVAHQRNRYSVVVSGGLKVIKQHHVYMEDF